MRGWNILISERSADEYDVCLTFPGAPKRGYRFVRRLPPDFSDFHGVDCADAPARNWRRAPGAADEDDGLLFCARDLATLKEIGSRLYASLFTDPDAPRDFTGEFLTAREMAASTGSGLGLHIHLDEAAELARVPWEALYLASDDLFLGIDTNSNIVRVLSPDRPGNPPSEVTPPVRLLVAIANPEGELAGGTEAADLEMRVAGLLEEGSSLYAVQTLPRATRRQLRSRIENWKPHIIHFIGHGGFDDEKGLIFLHKEGNPEQRDPVDSAALRDLVRNDRPWLVVLNSCLSGTAARADPFGGAAQNLIRVDVPFVVAMQSPISDEAATCFSQSFYASLVRKESVATAVTRGRNAIRFLGEDSLQPELITPVLYSTGQADKIQIRQRGALLDRAQKWWRQGKEVVFFLAAVGGIVAAVPIIFGDDGNQPAQEAASSSSPPASVGDPNRSSSDRLGGAGAAAGPSVAAASPVHAERQAWRHPASPPPRAHVARPAGSPLRPANGPSGAAFVLPGLSLPPVPFAYVPSAPAPPPPQVVPAPSPAARPSPPSPRIGGFDGQSSYASVEADAADSIVNLSGSVRYEVVTTGSWSRADRERIQAWRRAVRNREQGPFGSAAEVETVAARLQALTGAVFATFGWSAPVGYERRYASAAGGAVLPSDVDTQAKRFHFIFFPARSAAIGDEGAEQLDRLALMLHGGERISVAGHSGEGRSARRERQLSEQRVQVVLDHLAGRGKLPPAVARVALGATEPLIGVTDRRLRRLHDRVEVVIEPPPPAAREPAADAIHAVAYFESGSDRPTASALAREFTALPQRPDRDLAVWLTGHADPAEALATPELALARAREVGEYFRWLSGGDEQVLLEAAPPAAGAAELPVSQYPSARRVDAGLVLRGADRIRFGAVDGALAPEAGGALDRIAEWAGENHEFSLQVVGETGTDEEAGSARARAERIRDELQGRGIQPVRLSVGTVPGNGQGTDGASVRVVVMPPPDE